MDLNINPDLKALWDAIDEVGQVPCQNFPDAFLADSDDPDMASLRHAAKSLCAECPIKKQCFEYGFKHEDLGVYGGVTAHERAKMKGRSRIYIRVRD